MAIKKNNARAVVFYFAYCSLLVVLCFGFSPIINFYSTDSSVFYSIGKAMTQGTVVYRDIFDHKGLWIYLFNCWGACLDSVFGGWGMCIVEAVVYITIALTADRIFALFIKHEKTRVILSCLFLGLSLNYFTYQGGNYTETYALALQMMSCTLIAEYWFGNNECDGHPPMHMFIHGVCSGICLFLRMNLVGIWIPFGIAITIQLISKKQIKNLIMNFLALLCGVMIATIPVAIYGIANSCIKDMVFCMFTYNLAYVGEGVTFASFIKALLLQGASIVLLVGIAGAVIITTSKNAPVIFKWMFSAGYLFVLYVTFMGMRAYGHYYQILLPYTIPVFVFFGMKLERNDFEIQRKAVFAVIMTACFAITILGNMRAIIKFGPFDNEYKYLYNTIEKADEYISADDDKSLLATSNLMQAYLITDTVPNTKYPYMPGATLPEASEAMYKDILSGNYKYIFGTGYHNGYWDIRSGEERQIINEFISKNYTPISISDSYSYVMFMRNNDTGGNT